jgi:membrane protease subunit HflC
MKYTPGVIGAVALALIFVAFNTFFVVEQREQALITQFGDPVRTVQEPGLAVKMPFVQTVTFFDKRILELDAPPEEVIASDRRRIVVDAFARYRIVNPLRYYQSVRTDAVARQRLASILSSSLRGVLGKKSFAALLSSERPQLMQSIRDQIKVQALGLGIEIKDVRIRRADLPKENLESVFGRMQTEREREAAGIRASGDADPEYGRQGRDDPQGERDAEIRDSSRRGRCGEEPCVGRRLWPRP